LKFKFFSFILLCVFFSYTGIANSSFISSNSASLMALDKVTARVSEIFIEVGKPELFGTLEINMFICHSTPPEDPPESAVYLSIDEIRSGEQLNPLFKGWMFASSPGLNPLEHPVYDVWVLRCIDEEEKQIDSGLAPQTGE